MRAISLLYHDVVLPGKFASSGFPGGDASVYKLELREFERHLKAIRSAIQRPPVTVAGTADGSSCPLLLTFDDGGVSAHEYIAGPLEDLGWRGHFFMTTEWIGKPGFLTASQLRNLEARGHVIGSHSCTHPARMSHCSRRQLQQEWSNSLGALSDILGRRVDLASVPGGYYGQNVAEAAAECGIKMLFTSEPHTRGQMVEGCTVLGRYTIRQGVKATTAAAIANGSLWPRCQQLAYWNAKKVLKTAGGTSWLRMRKWLLSE